VRFSKVLLSLVPCLSLVLVTQAETTNVLDWQFASGNNPAVPTAATTINPDGGSPLATFIDSSPSGNGINWSGPTRPGAGSPTGTWEVDFGQLLLTMDVGAIGPVSYTLQVFQFIDNTGFFPGNLSLSPEGSQLVSSSVYVPQTAGMIGAWYVNTYTWSAVSLDPTIALDITGAGGNPILLDEVKLTIVGNLTQVPEPSCSLIAAAGLFAFGLRSWSRRKA
jgi:hypothetical protein